MTAANSASDQVVRTLAGNRPLDWLIAELDKQRQSGKRIVTTNGCFDLIHPGHVAFLTAARAQGDVLVVLLNTDESVRRLKGDSRPIIGEEGRAAVLLGMRAVDYVVLFDELVPNKMLASIRPDIHCKASDYRVDELPEAEVVERGGGQIRILPMIEGYSTTQLASRIVWAHP
jgi:glycerol-3-phosphate cytidylyltransferase